MILKREGILARVQETLETMVTPSSSNASSPFTMTHHLEQLNSIGLWPISKGFHSATIAGIVSKLLRYKTCDRAYCGCSQAGLVGKVKTFAVNMQADRRGLCLSCYKQGRATHEEGNCLAYLAEFCGRTVAEPANVLPPAFLV